jgi:hypothetical protein
MDYKLLFLCLLLLNIDLMTSCPEILTVGQDKVFYYCIKIDCISSWNDQISHIYAVKIVFGVRL